MADYLLGIDYGTGGAKACLIDLAGNVLGFAFEEYPFIHERPGWSEHDAENYWQAARRLIRAVIAQARVAPHEIKGIACSSALPSMVMVDREGQPIHRAYNLMDRRATAEVEWLKREIGEERIFQVSANRLEDHPTLVNLLWEKNHRPESFQRIWKALTIDGFATLRLTGRATLNYSAAGFYGVAYNVREGRFEPEIMQEIGIDMALMPDLYACTDIVGEVTPWAAEQTGLAAGTPVAAGQVDCNAGWVGAGAIEVGDVQSNLGTVGNFGVIHQDPSFLYSPVGRMMINVAYTIDSKNTYITIPSTTTGGQSIRYLRDQFGQAELQAERMLGIDAYDLLNMQAEKVPPGSGGLIVLPFLMGERTPIWDVYARGVVFGLSLHHTKGHLVRAMMEAVAYALYDSYRLIRESGLKINYPIILNEGGAKSALWRRIITDVFDAPTALVKRRTGAPFGDAILAGVATGYLPGFHVAREWVEYIEPMEPIRENCELYRKYFALYKNLYEHVRDDFRKLADLRAI
ncbi:MAG: FGGY-family carbohydrate kinase [Chloroflexi bacterium]|nr:FGGY-family carbohydrate kinase [Chloroflexota bacterium]